MALDIFKCENCGARLPPPPTSLKMIVCEFCKNAMLNPFFVQPVAAAPAPVAAPVAAPAAAPVAAPVAAPMAAGASMQPIAAPGRQVRPRTAAEIARLAQAHLKIFESLFHAPSIPAGKEQGARKGYGALIPAGEAILSLFDSTLFGGADDGFVITPERFGWKNIALDPHVMPWGMLDVSTLKITKDDLKFMGDVIQLESSSELQGRLASFLHAMAEPVYAEAAVAHAPTGAPSKAAEAAKVVPAMKSAPQVQPPAQPQPQTQPLSEPSFKPSGKVAPAVAAGVVGLATKGRPAEPVMMKGRPAEPSAGPLVTKGVLKGKSGGRSQAEEEDDDEGDRESWLEDTLEYAGQFFKEHESLFVHPEIPRDKERAARRAHSDEMDDDDDIAVVYDATARGTGEDGFVITPYGLFWKNHGEDANVVWWEELDMDDVELEDGALTIEGDEVQINSDAKGLARQLHRMMEAMVDWAQGE